MKITSFLLSLPPYFSARWEFIQSIRMQENVLIVTLKDGSSSTIPHLSNDEISQIFHSFALYAEAPPTITTQENPLKRDISQLVEGVKKGFSDFVHILSKSGGNALGFAKALEHDPSNANMPPLPPEAIQKIEMLLQIVPEEDIMAMQAPIDHCMCMYCQVQRLLRQALFKKKEIGENEGEPVDENELKFNEWIVSPVSDKLYSVRNKLDPEEEYRVFLGEPLGCTCGKANCEHIIAVLRS